LSKQFQRIKKLRAESNGNSILAAEYDYDNSSIKRDFRRLHESYNATTKANVIVKRRIDKMRNKVDHIKTEVERDELNSVKEVDINKMISKSVQSASSSSNGAAQGSKSKA
jgi:conjugal transfer/entry exclusion protein